MMETLSYSNFDIKIIDSGDSYTVEVTDSPFGQAKTRFDSPFQKDKILKFNTEIGHRRSQVRRGHYPVASLESNKTEDLGAYLFDALFKDDVKTCFHTSLGIAKKLRIRLMLSDAPNLVDVPWEYSFDRTNDRFPFLYAETPLVRHVALPESVKPLKVEKQLKILLVISSPEGYPQLDTSEEIRKIKNALRNLRGNIVPTLTVLRNATVSRLISKLRTDKPHILHYIGHGGFDEENSKGVLVLEDEQGKPSLLSGKHLRTVLHDCDYLRLVVLNSCEGARMAGADPFAGVAQSLLKARIPAVIAMQFDISDKASVMFSKEFYKSVSLGLPIETALAEARKCLNLEKGCLVEWGTPVLYMRRSDGLIFITEPRDRGHILIMALFFLLAIATLTAINGLTKSVEELYSLFSNEEFARIPIITVVQGKESESAYFGVTITASVPESKDFNELKLEYKLFDSALSTEWICLEEDSSSEIMHEISSINVPRNWPEDFDANATNLVVKATAFFSEDSTFSMDTIIVYSNIDNV